MSAPRRGWGAGVLLAALLGASPAPAAGEGELAALGLTVPRERRPAPAFTLPVLGGAEGREASLADHAGHLVLLNFWATWCEPCVRELPALDTLGRDLGDRGLTVLVVNVDRGRPKHVARYTERMGLAVPVLLDRKGAVRRAYEVRALPTTYLIGRDGRILGRTLGEATWDDAAHRAALESLLDDGADRPPQDVTPIPPLEGPEP